MERIWKKKVAEGTINFVRDDGRIIHGLARMKSEKETAYINWSAVSARIINARFCLKVCGIFLKEKMTETVKGKHQRNM